jgi:hypothetical protein
MKKSADLKKSSIKAVQLLSMLLDSEHHKHAVSQSPLLVRVALPSAKSCTAVFQLRFGKLLNKVPLKQIQARSLFFFHGLARSRTDFDLSVSVSFAQAMKLDKHILTEHGAACCHSLRACVFSLCPHPRLAFSTGEEEIVFKLVQSLQEKYTRCFLLFLGHLAARLSDLRSVAGCCSPSRI